MEFIDLVKKRQSDRKYKNTPVDREIKIGSVCM